MPRDVAIKCLICGATGNLYVVGKRVICGDHLPRKCPLCNGTKTVSQVNPVTKEGGPAPCVCVKWPS